MPTCCVPYSASLLQKKVVATFVYTLLVGILKEYMTDDVNRRNIVIIVSNDAQMLYTMLLLLYKKVVATFVYTSLVSYARGVYD